MTQFADFSAGRPGALALLQNGFGGVIRYVGLGSSGKRITAAEYLDYVRHGVQVALVAEYGIHDSEGGYAKGVANAKLALNDARALGIPDYITIFATADEHLSSSAIGPSIEYVKGFRDVLGIARTGAYGFSEFVNAVHNAGLASFFWQSGSEPTPAQKTWVNLWQRNKAPSIRTVNGIICDISEQYLSITGGINLTTLDDTFIVNDQSGKPLWPVTFASAIANMYAILFYGSHYQPWAGPPMATGLVAANSSLAAAQTEAVQLRQQVDALAAIVSSQNGLTIDQIKTAIQEELTAGIVQVDISVVDKTTT